MGAQKPDDGDDGSGRGTMMADNGSGTGMEDLSSLLEDDEQENGFDEDIRVAAPTAAGRHARRSAPAADHTAEAAHTQRQADAGMNPGTGTGMPRTGATGASASARQPTQSSPHQQPRRPYRQQQGRQTGPGSANPQGATTPSSAPASPHAPMGTDTDVDTGMSASAWPGPASVGAQGRMPTTAPADGTNHHAGQSAGRAQSRQSPAAPAPASGRADASSPASWGVNNGGSGFMPARAQGQAWSATHDGGIQDGWTHAGPAQVPAPASPASTSASARVNMNATAPGSASAPAPMRSRSPGASNGAASGSEVSPALSSASPSADHDRRRGHDRTRSHGHADGGGALADMGMDGDASVDEDMAEAVSPAVLKPDAGRPSPSPSSSSSSSSGSLPSKGRRPHGRLPHVPALKPYGSGHADAGGGAGPVNMPHVGMGGVLKHASASKPASSRRMHRPGDVYAKDETPESMTGPEAARARHGRVTPRRYRMRGPDRTKRVRRDHIGAVALSDPQERIIDRVNREYAKGKAFVPTDTDRRIWDYLALFRFATRSDVVRVGGWHGGYARQAPRIVRYGDLGLIIAERVPLSTLDYIQLTHEGMVMSSYAFLPDPSPTEATRGDRSHSLGLSSLASQLLTPSREYDQPGHDLLGVGDAEWAAIRREIRQGEAKVVGETIYRSAWSRMRSDAHARGRSQSAVTDPRVATLMNRIFREWKSKGGAKGDTLEWVCADPESQGEFAWLWMIYGGEAVRGGERDAQGRPRHIPPSERATDERGKIIAQPGDDIITRDHPPDMVIARHRQPGTGRPRSLAVELELTGKNVADYKATMSSYMSGNGKILYDKVVWLVVQASVANLIRTGAAWAGAVEGRDYIIAPVSNEENRSKDEFYDGLDMRPGSFKLTGSGNAYGYAIISSLMNEMDMEKEARQ